MEKLRAGKRGSLDSQTRVELQRLNSRLWFALNGCWNLEKGRRRRRRRGNSFDKVTTHYDARIFAGRKFARLCKSWVVREETSLKYSAGILIEERRGEKGESLLVFSWEQRGRYVMDDEGKRKEKKEKEEKFFWNDSVKPLEWNLQKFPVARCFSSSVYAKKICCIAAANLLRAFFQRTENWERKKSREPWRDYMENTKKKHDLVGD